MTRILYWNIQQFGINKINNPSLKRQRGASVNGQQASIDRRNYIMSTFATHVPDIIVVVEVQTGGGAQGTLITNSGGSQGVRSLLGFIQGALGATWSVVPPLILGGANNTEGVAVFYDSANLNFTGPFVWTGGPSIAAGAPGIGPLVNYPAPWNTALPAGNAPAGGNTINPGVAYRQLAGQWLFEDNAVPPNIIGFPGANNRPPFLTSFWDPTNNRTIKLLSFHASPNPGPAANGTNSLANIREMTTNLGANEVGVIVGDFNVNLFNTFYEPIAYTRLLTPAPGGAAYTRAINPTANTFPQKGFVCTHIKLSNQAKPWYTNGYPGYGYVGSNPQYPGYDSIDNVLTRYGGGGGPAANITIVNRITGTPYTQVAPPAGPPGTYVYPTAMDAFPVGHPQAGLPSALPLPPLGPTGNGGIAPGTIGGLSKFKGWNNYGKIRSTSDHLPLIIDV
ncbi:MAG: hypothetical protein AAFR59_08450 [Bacteroidota bacterium]